MNKAFVVMNNSTPIAVCPTEELANQTIATTISEAEKALEQLKAELLKPYRPEGDLGYCCATQGGECQFLSRTGYYYQTAEIAEYCSREAEFYHREDVVKLQRRQGGKYTIEEVDSYM